MIKAVLFDLDETLLDRREAIRAFVAGQYRRFAAQFPNIDGARYATAFLDIEKDGVVPKKQVYPALAERLGLDQQLAAALLADYVATYPSYATLRPAARETLAALRAEKFKTGLISNGEADVQFGKLDALNLRPLFDVILVSATEGMRKPDPEIFIRAAGRLGVAVEECVFVGDNPEVDIIGAEAAGMEGIWLKAETAWPAGAPPPRRPITSLDQIPKLVAGR